MGYALARAASKAGHKVTLISANTLLQKPKNAKVIEVVTSDQMYQAVRAEFPECDCLIMAAAVSDYKPAASSKTKIKKDQAEMTLTLKPTRDILKWAGKNKKAGQLLVGFALEDKNLLKNAEKKIAAKNLDMVVANKPTAIGAETSTIYIKTKTDNWQTFKNLSKTVSAKRILQFIERQ